ncbi:hypothetical protein [Polaromonas sp. CG9_12]|uniref:hypothetical protein n=1 Tax=Polaromonas sp. CG_9.11 TaxID=2787730 RepID=UPI0004DDCB8D|nr:hypothetical protein [Polaromonas sp. CG_9.11]MBG6074912.1 hypothetical protein [Polaromonas sp. CG_9.11]CDS54902.1 hypothetical protein [Polaromonas sp. CG9_12]
MKLSSLRQSSWLVLLAPIPAIRVQAHVGERFFGVTDSLESGSGLGRSIVRRIAAVHRLETQVGHSAELLRLAVCVNSE